MRIRTTLAALIATVSLIWLVVSEYPHVMGRANAAQPGTVASTSAGHSSTARSATAKAPAAKQLATKPKPASKPNPCAGNTDQAVLVSIAQQRVSLCQGSVLDAEYAVTTGRNGDDTPTGDYNVQALTRDTTLNPDTGGAYPVQYWIPFKWGMFGFHDAPWQTIPFGSKQYATGGSLGCVHMRTADIAHLFSWVHLGTRVSVR